MKRRRNTGRFDVDVHFDREQRMFLEDLVMNRLTAVHFVLETMLRKGEAPMDLVKQSFDDINLLVKKIRSLP